MQLIIIQNMTCQILLRALRCFLSEGLQARSTHIICFGYIQIFKTYIIRLGVILQHTHTLKSFLYHYDLLAQVGTFCHTTVNNHLFINYQPSIGFNIHHLSFHGVQQGSSQLQVLTHPCHNNVMLDLNPFCTKPWRIPPQQCSNTYISGLACINFLKFQDFS